MQRPPELRLGISGMPLKALISPFSTANEEADWQRRERRTEREKEKKQREIKNRAGGGAPGEESGGERGGGVFGDDSGVGICCVFRIKTN